MSTTPLYDETCEAQGFIPAYMKPRTHESFMLAQADRAYFAQAEAERPAAKRKPPAKKTAAKRKPAAKKTAAKKPGTSR